MTFNPHQNLTARDLLQHLSEQELTDIIRNYGEEVHAYKIAQAIVATRAVQPLETTYELVEVIKRAVPAAYARGRIHPATKTFQALRIAVNDEFDALKEGLTVVWKYLKPGGRLAVISFHSLEDRIVKVFMKEKADASAGILLTKKPQVSTNQEVAENPRSRSAKLRSIEKTI